MSKLSQILNGVVLDIWYDPQEQVCKAIVQRDLKCYEVTFGCHLEDTQKISEKEVDCKTVASVHQLKKLATESVKELCKIILLLAGDTSECVRDCVAGNRKEEICTEVAKKFIDMITNLDMFKHVVNL